MLSFSSDQINELRAARAGALAGALAERALARHPRLCDVWELDTLAQALEEEIARARAVGLTGRAALERWADLACTLGMGFSEQRGWAVAILHSGRRPRRMLAELEERALFAARGA